MFEGAGANVETLTIEVASQEDVDYITTNATTLVLPDNAVVQIKGTVTEEETPEDEGTTDEGTTDEESTESGGSE